MYRQTTRSAKVRAASRAKLLAAARRLFSRRGYAGTTMRDVALSAKSSIGNLYFYFENKDALLRALLEEARRPVWDWADQAAAAAPRGAARMAIITYANIMRLLTTDRDLMRLIAMESTPRSLSRWAMEVHLERLRNNLLENFPELPEVDRELGLAMWSGAIRRLLERVVMGEVAAKPEAAAAFALRWNLRGLGVKQREIEAAIERTVETYISGKQGDSRD
jgi:AcrR family transcriptional regulator